MECILNDFTPHGQPLLNPAEYNPRKWDKDTIARLTESIQRFSVVDPIICNSAAERQNIVIGGDFRLAGLPTSFVALGCAEVPPAIHRLFAAAGSVEPP